MSDPIVLMPGEGTRVPDPMGFPMVLKALPTATHGAYVVAELLMPSGDGPRPHVHDDFEEAFYVLAGEFEYRLGHSVLRAPAGSFLLVPRGVEHSFKNVGSTEARYLAIVSPPPARTPREDSPESDHRRAAFDRDQ